MHVEKGKEREEKWEGTYDVSGGVSKMMKSEKIHSQTGNSTGCVVTHAKVLTSPCLLQTTAAMQKSELPPPPPHLSSKPQPGISVPQTSDTKIHEHRQASDLQEEQL